MSMYPKPNLPLFDIARSHRDDPETSKTAARQMNKSGKARTNAEIVLDAVRQWPDRTSTELGSVCEGLDLAEIRRRLTDLRQHGLIEATGSRPCKVKLTKQTTWGVVRRDAP